MNSFFNIHSCVFLICNKKSIVSTCTTYHVFVFPQMSISMLSWFMFFIQISFTVTCIILESRYNKFEWFLKICIFICTFKSYLSNLWHILSEYLGNGRERMIQLFSVAFVTVSYKIRCTWYQRPPFIPGQSDWCLQYVAQPARAGWKQDQRRRQDRHLEDNPDLWEAVEGACSHCMGHLTCTGGVSAC